MVPFLIGNDGKHFKRITNMSNTNYIWWNNDTKVIEVWGPENRLDLAENILILPKSLIPMHKKSRPNNTENEKGLGTPVSKGFIMEYLSSHCRAGIKTIIIQQPRNSGIIKFLYFTIISI